MFDFAGIGDFLSMEGDVAQHPSKVGKDFLLDVLSSQRQYQERKAQEQEQAVARPFMTHANSAGWGRRQRDAASGQSAQRAVYINGTAYYPDSGTSYSPGGAGWQR